MNTIIAVTIVYLPRYVRLVRASALAELPKDYVTAAKVSGVKPFRLMTETVFPNCAAPLIVQGALGISDGMLEAAGLGFLGLGAQPPMPEWGAMLADCARVHHRCAMDHDDAGTGNLDHGALHQSGRRRIARCARSEAEEVMRCPFSKSAT